MLVAANNVIDHSSGPGPSFTMRILIDPNGNLVEDRLTVARGSSGIYINNGLGSFFTIDGRIAAGWRINYGDTSSGVNIDGSAASNVTLRFIQTWGPGIISQTGDVRGFDLTPNTGSMANLTMQYCESGGGGDSNMYLTKATGALIEHCSFHDADAANEATFHPNTIYCGQITNSVFRYNQLYNIAVEGLFFGDSGNSNVQIYDNLFYQGSMKPNSGRAIEFDNASSGNTNFRVYNNTIVALPIGVHFGGGGTFSACSFENNILYQDTMNTASGWTLSNNISPSTSPFVSAATFNYRLSATNGAGANLGATYATDYSGFVRPSSGAWDAGAYEFAN
jgi:hypothetical protein